MGGGPCDFSVSPSPFGLDFGTLDFGTSDLGLTIYKIFFVFLCKSHLKYNPIDDCIDGAAVIEQYNVHDHKSKQEII